MAGLSLPTCYHLTMAILATLASGICDIPSELCVRPHADLEERFTSDKENLPKYLFIPYYSTSALVLVVSRVQHPYDPVLQRDSVLTHDCSHH